MSQVIIIAGSNGSGKSTAAPALLQDTVHINDFVNADIIAQGLSAFQSEKAAIQAGRIMLDRIRSLADEGANFAFETSLASRTFAGWVVKLKEKGYQFHLVFLWLKDAELAISRVADRVSMGGHSVPEKTIRRRYRAGLENFFNLYCPIADSWQLYDNSDAENLDSKAVKAEGNVKVENEITWKLPMEKYNE